MHTEPYTLRRAVPADAGFLADMLVAAVNWDPAREPLDRDAVFADPALAHYVTGWLREGDAGVVAVDEDGTPVGAAWVRLFAADDPGYGHVAPDVPEVSLGVVSDWRGQGVGRALLRELHALARAAGHRRLSLSVERANQAAARLYAAEGYATVSGDAEADTMVKHLTP
ncbi:GNAT family N-acetyltransferase [Streptomyces sp. TRM 70351]|uniref:GNAT family N-acetyltransferase n=1 Tax=Streptomyces sp. TRM 70351 TaxID=3116552 RepID=UPI002E7B8594|nr:GNAT family N-acetyltransferase [Streptomyces sp. TRM 70351]MEE1928715.1 GNAT family N-acetyltransferase [Streptomyces sp. TRM 70351]